MKKNPIFWESLEQASERLVGTFIRYGDNPCYVENLDRKGVNIVLYPSGERKLVELSDPAFLRFRVPLPTGWFNHHALGTALFVERLPARTRLHGFSDNHVRVSRHPSTPQRERLRFVNTVSDPGYTAAIANDYPSVDEVVANIQKDSAIAVASNYAVYCDRHNFVWLYRNRNRAGMFSSPQKVVLSRPYYREELACHPTLKITIEGN